jgi:hypothetical protein
MTQDWPPQTVLNWIKKLVNGKSFADVGGLWYETHETVTYAALAGAKEKSMCDMIDFSWHWWDKFRARCKLNNISNVKEIISNVDNEKFVDLLGVHDVVHCGGIIYHCPDPVYSVGQLCKVTKKYLILGTHVVTNDFNRHIMPGSSIFLPGLNENQTIAIAKWLGHKKMYPIYNHDGDKRYYPFWWLPTSEVVEGWIKVNGFKVIEVHKERTIHYFLCKKEKEVKII